MSNTLNLLSETLSVNGRMEVLELCEMKYKQNDYKNFWSKITTNRGLKKICVANT